MDYTVTKDAPLIIQVWREFTSKQTLMFLIVVSLLLFAGLTLRRDGQLGAIETPLMLIIGYFFGESTLVASALAAKRETQRFYVTPEAVQPITRFQAQSRLEPVEPVLKKE